MTFGRKNGIWYAQIGDRVLTASTWRCLAQKIALYWQGA